MAEGSAEASGEAEVSDADLEAEAENTASQERAANTVTIRRSSLRNAALAAAFVVLLAATGFLGWQVLQDRQLRQASEEAQRAAVSYAQVLTSIDSDKVDENFKEVLDGATGEFKDMYSQSSVELRQLLVENKATARGVVVDSAVQSASKDKAVVLLFVDQSVSNTKLPDPRIDRSRMKMTLEKVDGRWRASKVELP
ncbi:MAG: Mce protein [Actinomycetota bacterium]|nr:Mce protein [Actinomycetota bacterium]MDA2948870.1 Mce protein [Actinomycetota bacterium]MDA2990289.1 Mce protein [Actinomycetota bacterium]